MFSRYCLRTTEIENARRFYEDALGLVLPDGSAAQTCLEAWPLHERARSAGAPAHWLGQLEVDDLEDALRSMIAEGAQTLGPTVRAPDGTTWATIRDPWGAVFALRARTQAPPDRPVDWHQLHTSELDRAWSTYTKISGWRDAGTVDAPDLEEGHRLFAFSEEAVGSVANTATLAGRAFALAVLSSGRRCRSRFGANSSPRRHRVGATHLGKRPAHGRVRRSAGRSVRRDRSRVTRAAQVNRLRFRLRFRFRFRFRFRLRFLESRPPSSESIAAKRSRSVTWFDSFGVRQSTGAIAGLKRDASRRFATLHLSIPAS